MFGNRKRKLPEDEESLVPHGLIWHATAEPTPEELAKSEESLGYTINYAEEIDRARRAASLTPIEETPKGAPQVPAARSSVIPWWRMEQPQPTVEPPVSKLTPMPLSAYVPTPIEPEVEPPRPYQIQPMQIRPMPVEPIDVQPAAPPPAVQPIQAIPIATPSVPAVQILQASAPQVQVEGSMARSVQVHSSPAPEPLANLPTSTPRVEDRLVPKSSEITEALALAFARLRAAGKSGWLSLGSLSGKAVQRGRQTVQSLELGEGLARAGKQGQNLLRGGITKTGHYARATSSALGAFSRAGASRVQQISARVRTASTPANGDVVRPVNTRPSTPSRVRVLLATSALQTRIIIAQQLSAWRMRRERMAIDSRFWASMTMAAIAAVLALVIVSVVPHFAARSLPSRILNTNPSVNASVAAPAAASSAPVHRPDALARKAATGTQTTASKTDSAKASSEKVASNSKPKHLADDDYVAPNTYKYYGTGSKSSR